MGLYVLLRITLMPRIRAYTFYYELPNASNWGLYVLLRITLMPRIEG